jgi:phosphonatase-like hydrolase
MPTLAPTERGSPISSTMPSAPRTSSRTAVFCRRRGVARNRRTHCARLAYPSSPSHLCVTGRTYLEAQFLEADSDMAYRLAVFDMAGTTVSNSDLVVDALVGTLGARGFAVKVEDARALMGYPKPQAIRQLLGPHGAASDALVQALYRDFVARMLQRYRDSPDIAPMPDAEACFERLHARGLRIALNTGFSRDIAHVIVERFGWLQNGIIDDVIATDEVVSGRPQPDMIRALMARQGVSDSSDVIKVGDTEVDIREGRAVHAGLVVAVTTGAFDRAQLERFSPDHIIDNLMELVPLLDRSRS